MKKDVSQTLSERQSAWSYRVLVVDDEPDIATSIQLILQGPEKEPSPVFQSSRSLGPSRGNATATEKVEPNESFEVDVANSFEEALELVSKSLAEGRPYAMGFFDVVLGSGRDGFDLVKEIQSLDGDIYSVFVTAYNDRSIDSIDSYLGADKTYRWDYMNKPFTEGEILQKARNFTALWNLKKERSTMENQLAHLQSQLSEMDRASAAAAVARGMGHEFGNILMQIMGKADLAQSKGPEEMQQALGIVVDACQRASDILDRFKDLSSESSSQNSKEMFSLPKVLEETLTLLEHQFRNSNVEPILKEVHANTDAFVHSTALLQVLINLSINAMHAMPQGGKIEYSILDQGDQVVIEVRDHGTGIDQDLVERVTEAFFTTKGEAGTGIGLSICKEIIEIEHQGEFALENHSDGGVVVKMTLPKVAYREVQSA